MQEVSFCLYLWRKSGGRDLEMDMIWIDTLYHYEGTGWWLYNWFLGEYRSRDAEQRFRGTEIVGMFHRL